jgi:hypothetical protein
VKEFLEQIAAKERSHRPHSDCGMGDCSIASYSRPTSAANSSADSPCCAERLIAALELD